MKAFLILTAIVLFQSLSLGKVLFFENFEDNNFAQRGWYDQLKGKLSTDEHIEGSKYSLECKFLKGARTPEEGTPGRHLFEMSDAVCLSYYVKYSDNYIGSGKPYHPHEFSFVTNKDSKWVGPAFTHLTTYIEHNGGIPLLAIQDGENIDQTKIGVNLVGITEERGVAGCNGSSDSYPDDCYKSGNVYVNGKQWKANKKYFSDSPGKYYKNDWHRIEAYFKLNSIENGKGLNNGIVRYWFDGELIIDHTDILMRTGEHPDMKFNQFLIVPYIGDGSPVEQTMWIDDLKVTDQRDTIINSVSDYESEFSISPNPASDFIEISYSPSQMSFPRKRESIRVYNVFGEDKTPLTLFEKWGKDNSSSHYSVLNTQYSCKIDVSTLPPGLYFVRVGERVGKFLKVD